MKSPLIKIIHIAIIFIFTFNHISGKNPTNTELSPLLEGVKYASINIHSPQNKNAFLVREVGTAFKNYFIFMGFEEVVVSKQEKENLTQHLSTYCDLVEIDFSFQYTQKALENMALSFHFCDGKDIDIFFDQIIKVDDSILQNLLKIWTETTLFRQSYNSNQRLSMRQNSIKYSEKTVQWLIKDAEMQFIEGIYQVHGLKTPNIYSNLRVAIIRNQVQGYHILYLDGANNFIDWREGEVTGYIHDSVSDDSFVSFSNINWYFLDKKPTFKAHIVFKGKNKDEFLLSFGDSDIIIPFKKVPPPPVCEKVFSFGSGIALTVEGHILTNYHVIKDATCIQVETSDGVVYNAKLVKQNIEDDIAILKITDWNFEHLPPIVYSFYGQQIELGEHIFTLGYPRYSSDRELKLRTGEVTSKNGYNNDTSTYETSLNVHRGSSGGAVLSSSSGEMVGLVKSKYAKSASISFIIKPSVLLKTINTLPSPISLPKSRVLVGLSLKEQVKLLKPFVFNVRSLN